MSCKYCVNNNMCKSTNGKCMFNVSNSELCKMIYCDGPDVTRREHLYRVKYIVRSDSIFTGEDTPHYKHIYADDRAQAYEMFTRQYPDTKDVIVFQAVREIDFRVVKLGDVNRVMFMDIPILEASMINSEPIYYVYNGDEKSIIIENADDITGIAFTEKYVIVQYYRRNPEGERYLAQECLNITDELRKYL